MGGRVTVVYGHASGMGCNASYVEGLANRWSLQAGVLPPIVRKARWQRALGVVPQVRRHPARARRRHPRLRLGLRPGQRQPAGQTAGLRLRVRGRPGVAVPLVTTGRQRPRKPGTTGAATSPPSCAPARSMTTKASVRAMSPATRYIMYRGMEGSGQERVWRPLAGCTYHHRKGRRRRAGRHPAQAGQGRRGDDFSSTSLRRRHRDRRTYHGYDAIPTAIDDAGPDARMVLRRYTHIHVEKNTSEVDREIFTDYWEGRLTTAPSATARLSRSKTPGSPATLSAAPKPNGPLAWSTPPTTSGCANPSYPSPTGRLRHQRHPSRPRGDHYERTSIRCSSKAA